eukprot:XP_001689680.1 predicted protein [Chlamydomonas reinhardtii]
MTTGGSTCASAKEATFRDERFKHVYSFAKQIGIDTKRCNFRKFGTPHCVPARIGPRRNGPFPVETLHLVSGPLSLQC